MWRITETDLEGYTSTVVEGTLEEVQEASGFKGGTLKEFENFLATEAMGSLFYDYTLEEI